MKRILSILVALVTLTVSMLSMNLCVAAEDSDSILASTHWTTIHRWDFEGDLTDSVGGAVAVPLDRAYYTDPTYADGKIVLDGNQAYTFAEEMTFDTTKYPNSAGGLRIDIKARMDFENAPQSAHRVFGYNVTDGTTAGMTFINIAGSKYNGCAFAFSTTSKAWDSFVIKPDLASFNPNIEHHYTFIYYQSHLYYYADGVLIGDVANAQGGKYVFTDFLGCSYIDENKDYNFYGEIDYLQIAIYEPNAENDVITIPPTTEAPVTDPTETDPPVQTTPEATEPAGTTSQGTTDEVTEAPAVTTEDVADNDDEKKDDALVPILIAVVAVVVIAVVVIVVIKKKNK